MAKKILALILTLGAFAVQAQDSTVCTTLRIGRLIQRDLQIKDAQDTLIRIQEKHIQGLTKEINKYDSISLLKGQQIVAKDSVIQNLHKAMDYKDEIIVKLSHRKAVRWFWIPVAIFVGWCAGR